MASNTDKEEVIGSDGELETHYPVNKEQQKPGSSAKFYATEGQSQELSMTTFERLINHFNSHLEGKTLLEKQLKEKENEMNNLLKEAVAEFDKNKKETQTLKSENQKLKNESASYKNDAKTELNKMMTEKEEAINKLQNDIKIEKTRTTSVEQRLKEMLGSATAENYEMKCTKTELEEKVKETQQRINPLQSENYALQKQIVEKETQCDELRREKLENEPLAELHPDKKEIQSLKNLLQNNHSLRKLNEMDLRTNLSKNSTSLDIKNKTIDYVASGTFDNLSSLTELNLSFCGLTFLEKGVFNNLTNLITLNLSHNNLSCLEGNVFAGLKKLKKISLYNNNITKLPPQLFRGLESLEVIYLSALREIDGQN